jgi:serine/threonine protein kinase
MKLCAGLGAVHEAGIVHRDIKPENVYLVERKSDPDFVKLVDFGIARILDGVGDTTQAGKVFGTAAYISPEAASGELADPQSDIYSLGVLSYQLLTGELPFEGNSVASVVMQHVHQPPPHLNTKGRGADVPPEVADVVMQALSKERQARQGSLAEFLDALAEAAGTAGLLNDARKLLLGTVWGDDLAAPGSYLGDLLSSSAPPSVPPALEDTQRVVVERDPDEEAFLSSAPKPFGTTSFDLEVNRARPTRRASFLWTSLGLISLAFAGFMASALLRDPPNVASQRESEPEVVEREPTVIAEQSEPTVIAESPAALPFVGPEAPPDEPVIDTPEPEPEPSKPKPKQKRRRSKPKPAASPAAPPSSPVVLEPDEGIDWSLPDFPEETGNPGQPSPAPVVIDEPPSR